MISPRYNQQNHKYHTMPEGVQETIENWRRWFPGPRTQPSSGLRAQNTAVVRFWDPQLSTQMFAHCMAVRPKPTGVHNSLTHRLSAHCPPAVVACLVNSTLEATLEDNTGCLACKNGRCTVTGHHRLAAQTAQIILLMARERHQGQGHLLKN